MGQYTVLISSTASRKEYHHSSGPSHLSYSKWRHSKLYAQDEIQITFFNYNMLNVLDIPVISIIMTDRS